MNNQFPNFGMNQSKIFGITPDYKPRAVIRIVGHADSITSYRYKVTKVTKKGRWATHCPQGAESGLNTAVLGNFQKFNKRGNICYEMITTVENFNTDLMRFIRIFKKLQNLDILKLDNCAFMPEVMPIISISTPYKA